MSNAPEKDDKAALEALEESLYDALEAADQQQVAEIIEGASNQDILRHASQMTADERDHLISIMTPEAAAELIEEAPSGLAVAMIKDLDSSVAAKIMEELVISPVFLIGLFWGGRIRTSEWRYQKPLPYHLATPQHRKNSSNHHS